MREVSLIFLVLLSLKQCYSLGNTNTENNNFQVLLGDVELGPLSQQPELFKVAALQNVLVNVTDDQQTAVVTVGVNIRLDWSSWVSEVQGGSAVNASYQYYRTQLNESGSAIVSSEVLQPSERISISTNEELNLFFVEITCAIIAAENESDRAIYELEACVPQSNGSERCYRSNITVYAIERPEPLTVICFGRGTRGQVSIGCISVTNPIVLRTCTVEALDIGLSVNVPCNNTDVTLTARNYAPRNYNITFNFTDIYGQTAHQVVFAPLSEPPLFGSCEFAIDGQSIYCRTSLDTSMVIVTYNCSFDGGPPLPCGQNITIDRASFSPGFHILMVTFMTQGGQTFTTILAFGVFELSCTADANRTLEVRCQGVHGVINDSEVLCIYDNAPVGQICELPVTIDFAQYDRQPGFHNITIIANSTLGYTDDYTHPFIVQDIECVQLTEPGRVTVICQTRVTLNREIPPLCLFDELNVNVPCNDISNIVIVPSEIPFLSDITGNLSLFISGFDPIGSRIRTTLRVQLTQEQMVECSTTLNCSSNSTLMLARECCVDSTDGLSYSTPGQEQCHTCIVFGWFQDSFSGMEQETAHNLSTGYLKGAEHAGAGARITLNVISVSGNASKSDVSLETTIIQLRPLGDLEAVLVTFLTDEIFQEDNETLTLRLVPTPSSLQTMPIGEAVFFKREIGLTIIDVNQLGPTGAPGSVSADLVGGVVGGVLSALIIGMVVLAISFFCYRYFRAARMSSKEIDHCQMWDEGDSYHLYSRANSGEEPTQISVKSKFKLDLPPELIIPSSSIKLNETIGQGEFGIVYKGYIIKGNRNSIDEYLAIKTLKGFYDRSMVKDMLKECSRMSQFNHVHVLTLRGVCLDGGPAPYIIMPFMANGSLLAYLKRNRKTLVISHENADNEDVEIVRKQLMDMCIQVAKGMEYFASVKVVHRDLAARNCMIDASFVIKVADFGLSESIGVKEYFRQDRDASIKLPLKWLPPESIGDYIFSEKSDVWAYGVTCWEIFTAGKVPYSELAVREIPKQLANGHRLEKPSNDACNEEMYSFMQECWSIEPEHRPTFSQLVGSLSNSLEGMAGYVHIGAFGIKTLKQIGDDDKIRDSIV